MKKSIWEFLCVYAETMRDGAIIIFAILTSKDPCNICLVAACCNDKCEERVVFENFILRGSPLKHQKLFAWFVVTYVSGIFIVLIYQIFIFINEAWSSGL